MQKARHDVGDLDARVVEIVLDLDGMAQPAQHADEDVSENRVAQVTDVGRLVGIDVGVLDDDLSRARRGRRDSGKQGADEGPAVEEEIEVAPALDLRLAHAGGEGHGRGELGRDRARRFPERFREVERDGAGEISHRDPGRPLEHDALGRDVGAELLARRGRDGRRERLSDGGQHGRAV